MVVDDPERARALCARGQDVVLMVDPGAPAWHPVGPGRAAVFVAGTGGAPDMEAAAEMAAELFGPVTSSGPGPAPG